MAGSQASTEHLTTYERAVCYYTLPRVTSPLTGGLVIAYTVVLLEAVALLVYGVVNEAENLTWWGGALTIGAIVFGVVAFFIRSLQNAVHERRALAQAALLPDRGQQLEDLPDPFAGHELMLFHRRPGQSQFEIKNNDGAVRYMVRSLRHDRHLEITDPGGQMIAEVEAFSSGRSFLFDFTGHPAEIHVHRGETLLARARRRYTFMDPTCDIFISEPAEMHLVTRRGAIFRNDRLVGRIYTVRQVTYLDIESSSLFDGVLGYYVAMG